MVDSPFDDLDRFKYTGPPVRDRKTPSRWKPRKRETVFPPPDVYYVAFLEGWISALANYKDAYLSLYRVALDIQRAAILQNTLSPKLTDKNTSVDRFTKARALDHLQGLGLCRVEQKRGCAPVVHIILKPEPERLGRTGT
jgi:hypothetical protein